MGETQKWKDFSLDIFPKLFLGSSKNIQFVLKIGGGGGAVGGIPTKIYFRKTFLVA